MPCRRSRARPPPCDAMRGLGGGLLLPCAITLPAAAPAGRLSTPDSAYPSPHMQAVSRPYPPAARLDTVDELHGHRIPDPYRWLEDPASPETVAWSEAQDRLCRDFLNALPGREH